MKTYYVYEIKDDSGKTVDVGVTYRPETRMYQHTKVKPGNGMGRHYGRDDISMVIACEYPTRKEANKEEGRLKLEHGLDWTEMQIWKANGIKVGNLPKNLTSQHQSESGKVSANKLRTCQFCGKENLKQVTLNMLNQEVLKQMFQEFLLLEMLLIKRIVKRLQPLVQVVWLH